MQHKRLSLQLSLPTPLKKKVTQFISIPVPNKDIVPKKSILKIHTTKKIKSEKKVHMTQQLDDEYDIFNEEVEQEVKDQSIGNEEFQVEEFQDLFPLTQRKWNTARDKQVNGSEIQQGKFSEEDIGKIMKAVVNYANKEGLSQEDLYKLCRDTSKSAFPKAWVEIAKCLPNRSVQSIHNLCHRKFNPDNYYGHWSEEEEAMLIQSVRQYGRKWKDISQIMKRTPINIRDKYKSMGEHNYQYRNKSNWTLGEIIHFLRLLSKPIGKRSQVIILEESGISLIQEILQVQIKAQQFQQEKKFWRNKSYQVNELDSTALCKLSLIVEKEMVVGLNCDAIPWTRIADRMKTKSKDDLRNLWLGQLFSWMKLSSELDFMDERELIESIKLQDAEEEGEIDFDLILPHEQQFSREQKRYKIDY